MADEIKTRMDDAKSIVGDELAEQLEINRSTAIDTVLIERNDEPIVEETKVTEKPENSQKEEEEEEISDKDGKKVKKEKSAVELALESVLAAKSADDVDAALASLAETVKSTLPSPKVPPINPEVEAIRSLVEKTQADILGAISVLTDKLEAVSTDVAILKASKTSDKIIEKVAVPAPRSVVASERVKALQPKRLTQIERIALQSVGELVE